MIRSSYNAVNSLRGASTAVKHLRLEVDLGQVPLIEYLRDLENEVSALADALETRLNEASGV